MGSCYLRLGKILEAPSIDGVQGWSDVETITCETGVLGYLLVNLQMHTRCSQGYRASGHLAANPSIVRMQRSVKKLIQLSCCLQLIISFNVQSI